METQSGIWYFFVWHSFLLKLWYGIILNRNIFGEHILCFISLIYVFTSVEAFTWGALGLIMEPSWITIHLIHWNIALQVSAHLVYMVYRVGSLVQGISCLHLLRIGIICGLPSLHSILNNSGNLNCGHRAFPEMMQKIDLVVIIIAMIKHHDKRNLRRKGFIWHCSPQKKSE